MNCQQARKLMSDKTDSLLPQKVERQFNIHLGECSLCDKDMRAMLNAKLLIKALYPGLKAPLGLKDRVMEEIKSQRSVSSYVLPLWLGKTLKPAAAIALSAALLFGILALNRDVGDLRVVPEEEWQVNENGTNNDMHGKLVESDTEKDKHIAQAVPDVAPVEPKPQDVAPVEPKTQDVAPVKTDKETLTIKQPTVNEEMPAINVVVVNVPTKQDKPIVIVIDKAAVKAPLPAASDADARIDEIVSTPVTSSDNKLFIFSQDDIPDPSIYIRRKRIIEAVSLNVSVQRMDKALSRIAEYAELFRLKPDMSVTEIRENGTIVVMKSFIVPAGRADFFATQLSISGSVTNRTRSSLDITSDYSQMLDEHKVLVDEVLNRGTGVGQLKSHGELLMLLNKRSQPGVENVVLWLEDSVDF